MQNTFRFSTFFTLIFIALVSNANADSGWITDPNNGCTFFNQVPQANETIRFQGQCNKKFAKGKLTWLLNGDFNQVVEGSWVDGKLKGHAIYEYKNGSKHVGNYQDNRRSGKGVFNWVSGSRYEGEFVEGKRTGKGTYQFANGALYVGDLLNNKRTGRGVLIYANKAKYVGEFLDGKRHGKGENTDQAGAIYTGEFFDDLESGRGTLVFPEGHTLTGSFSQGQPIGDVVASRKGGQKFFGRMENGVFIANDQNLDHTNCVRLGFASNTPEYATCRTQIEVAAKQAHAEDRTYQSRLLELQRSIEDDQRENRIALGLAALGAAARILQPPPPPSNTHTYNFSNGRSMTCRTVGPFTDCD